MLLVRNPKRKQDYDDLDDYYLYDFKKRGNYESCDKLKSLNLQLVCIKPAKKLIDQVLLKPVNPQSPKLFDMCLRFIALNVECVDSFRNLPSLIGHLIFMECIKVKKFEGQQYPTDLILECISLFSRAYPDLLIESINLNNLPKDLLIFMTKIINGCSVKKLNLSRTQLNELCNQKNVKKYSENASLKIELTSVLRNSQQTLEGLNLSENNLDEDFIQKFTLSQRLQSQNFHRLEYIDLSRNYKIRSLDFLKYLTKFEGLKEVLVSVLKNETVFVKDRLKEPNHFYGFRICVCSAAACTAFKQTGWFEKVCIEKLKPVQKQRQVDSLEEYKMIKNRNESVKISNKFYENKAKTEEQAKSAAENAKKLVSLFRVIRLKKQCACFDTKEDQVAANSCDVLAVKTTPPGRHTTTTNINNKSQKVVRNPLDKIVVDAGLFKMYM